MNAYMEQLLAKMDLFALLGLVGQTAFAMRFVTQWIASEKAKASVIPVSFWYWSLLGSLLMLVYGALRADPIIMLGYLFNNFIYVRNLMLIAGKTSPPVAPDAI